MGTWDYLSDGSDSATKLFSTISEGLSAYREIAASNMLSAGLTHFQKGNYKAAAGSLRLATAYSPGNTDAYNYLAKAYAKLGKPKEAIAAYKNSLDVDKTQSSVYVDLASVHIDQKNYAEAEKVLIKGSQVDPTNSLPVYTLGLLRLNNLNKPAEAAEAFRKTIRLAPNDANGYYALGAALNKEGHYTQALEPLKKALSLDRNNAAAMYELGNAYAELNRPDDAKAMISKLKGLKTSAASTMASNLEVAISNPKITGVNLDKSTFNPALPASSLLALDPMFVEPSTSKLFSVTFSFDSEMDINSVSNIANWTIERAKGGGAGLYDNGLYKPTDRGGTVIATKVTYNPVTREATVYFPISQNSDGDGTIDAGHLTFAFKGVDANGKAMDASADQYNGFAGKAF